MKYLSAGISSYSATHVYVFGQRVAILLPMIDALCVGRKGWLGGGGRATSEIMTLTNKSNLLRVKCSRKSCTWTGILKNLVPPTHNIQ